MEKVINVIDIETIIEKAELKVSNITKEALIKLSNKGFKSIDITAISKSSDKYCIAVSIDIGTIWAIKKQNIKVNISHLNFKYVKYNKYMDLVDIPTLNMEKIFCRDRYNMIEGTEFTGFEISKLFYSKNIIKSNIAVEFNNTTTELIFSEIKKETLIMRLNKLIRGVINYESRI